MLFSRFMKFRINVIFFQFFTLLMSPVLFAQTDCNHIITTPTTLDRVLLAAENYKEESILGNHSYHKTAMKQLGITNAEDLAVLSNALTVKPIIDSGILYEAIVAEGWLRDYKGGNKVKTLINNFSILLPSEKILIVDGILANMLYAFGNSNTVSASNLDAISTYAKRFQMSNDEVSTYLKTMRDLEKSNYEEVKIIIFDLLRKPSAQLIENVLKFKDHFSGTFLRTHYALRPPQPSIPLTADGKYESEAFRVYMRSLIPRERVRFLSNHWDKLYLQPLEMYRNDFKSDLIPEVLQQMDYKIELLITQHYLKIHQDQVATFEARIAHLHKKLNPEH